MQKGQALLLVVLIMVVGLTVGLAVASRSITNVRTSTEEENSQRAFSAAEAGIEEAIKQGCIPVPPPGTGCQTITGSFASDNQSQFSATVRLLEDDGTGIILNGGNSVLVDDGIDVWLVPHDSDGKPVYTTPWDGTVTLYWGAQSLTACEEAALELVLIYGDTVNTAKSNRYAFDECTNRRNGATGNHFEDPPGGGESFAGKNFNYKTRTISVSDGYVLRVIPLYKNTVLGIKSGGGNTLPSQGKIIESIGTSDPTKRKVTYFQGYPQLPAEFFPNILFWPKQ